MPEDPSKCLLEPGVAGTTFIFLSIGVFALLLGGVFLVAKISVIRDERRAADQSTAGDAVNAGAEE